MAARKKPTKRARAKKCDEMFSKIVRADACCVSCGEREFLQCSHGFSRSYHAVRWDRRNAVPQCRKCHTYYTHRPLEWDQWLRGYWGPDLYDELRALALTHRWPDMEKLHADLSEQLKALAS